MFLSVFLWDVEPENMQLSRFKKGLQGKANSKSPNILSF